MASDTPASPSLSLSPGGGRARLVRAGINLVPSGQPAGAAPGDIPMPACSPRGPWFHCSYYPVTPGPACKGSGEQGRVAFRCLSSSCRGIADTVSKERLLPECYQMPLTQALRCTSSVCVIFFLWWGGRRREAGVGSTPTRPETHNPEAGTIGKDAF